MSEMISFGAGVNSVAMTILLVNDGWCGPIVFADTGGEHPETYCYLDWFERDWLLPRGLSIVRLSPRTHEHLYDVKRLGGLAGPYTLEEYCMNRGIIPLLAVRWCTFEFKTTPLNNWAAEYHDATALIAFTVDEGHRKQREGNRYPLIERGITRMECVRIIQRAGLDLPRKSSCFFCPGQRLAEWRDLCLNYPELYERACVLEDNASERNGKIATFDSNEISLREKKRRRWEGLQEMDLSEWMPCICKI